LPAEPGDTREHLVEWAPLLAVLRRVVGALLGQQASCVCIDAAHTCVIGQAPSCGGTCPSGQICGVNGGSCVCVDTEHTCEKGVQRRNWRYNHANVRAEGGRFELRYDEATV